MSLGPVTFGMVCQGRRQKKNYPAVKIHPGKFELGPQKSFSVRPNFHRFGGFTWDILNAKRACLAPKLDNVTGGENCLGPPCGESHVDQIQGRAEQQFRPPWPTGRTEHCRTLKHSPSSAMLLIVGARWGTTLSVLSRRTGLWGTGTCHSTLGAYKRLPACRCQSHG